MATAGFVLPGQGLGTLCTAQSGPHTTALVELYLSERCPKCPAAERALSKLASRDPDGQALLPVLLHLDERAHRREGLRPERRLTIRQRIALLHTPRVLLQGREFPSWEGPSFEAALAKIQARPPGAWLAIELLSTSPDGMAVRIEAAVLEPAHREEAALYVAPYGKREQRLVLEWQGPIAFREPRIVEERVLPLLPERLEANSGVIAFVQHRRTGEVLQALMRPAC